MSTSASLGDVLRRELAGMINLSEPQVRTLTAHYELMLSWNARMALTTVTGVEEAAIRHYCESLVLGTHISPGRVADIGSGPGFPGIPAAILRPDCRFDLVESNQRKAVFLREAARGMGNVRVVAGRAEALRGEYDWVVARAVDPDEVLRLKVASRFALLIGADDAGRIGAAQIQLPWGDRRVVALVSRETVGDV